MFKFDRINSLAEMKELCFYIKTINEAKKENCFDINDLMKFKNFLKSRYNLEVAVSKLYLFVEKIEYLTNNKKELPETKELEKIVKEYLKYHKKLLKDCEVNIAKAELNTTDPKYNLGQCGFKSAKELSEDISVNKKLYNNYTNWILLTAFAIALFVSSGIVVFVGAFNPIFLTYFMGKFQEIFLFVLTLCCLTYSFYFLIDFLYRKKTWHLKIQIDGYNKYLIEIQEDYNKLIEARREYANKISEFSINGIEFPEQLLFNYLTLNDDMDVKSYSTTKINNENKTNSSKKSKNVGTILSKKEQDYLWQTSDISRMEKLNINTELVKRVDKLAQVLKDRKVSTINLAKEISELYCNDLSIEKRKSRIDSASSRNELYSNYLETLEKIENFEKMSFFDLKHDKISKELYLTKEEKSSMEEDIRLTCDRIEKAYALHLIDDMKFLSYKQIEEDFSRKYIYGKNIEDIESRAEFIKVYLKLHEELSLYDILN